MGKYDLQSVRDNLTGGRRIPPEKIVAWIKRNFDTKPRKNGTEYRINSPFDADTGYNFNISPEKGGCHDWRGDEWAGPINPSTGKRNCTFLKFVRLFKKCSYTEAVRDVLGAETDIRAYLKPDARLTPDKPQRKVTVALPEGVEPLAPATDLQARSLIKWLMVRGYTRESIEKHDIQYLGMDVYWPYFEFDELVYWQSRSRMNKRFLFPPENVYDPEGNVIGKSEGTKGDFFYGFDDVEPATYLIITESIFGQNTLCEQTLASGGADLTPKQISKLKILGPRKGVILSPDNDKAGIKSIIRNGQQLRRHGFDVLFSIPPKIEYVKNEEKKLTKDWNELVEHCSMTCTAVRQLHDKNLRRLTASELSKLHESLRAA